MKKIISALALASLTFGAAFADASMSLNYRTQGMFYTTDTVDNYNDFLSNRALGGTNDDVNSPPQMTLPRLNSALDLPQKVVEICLKVCTNMMLS